MYKSTNLQLAFADAPNLGTRIIRILPYGACGADGLLVPSDIEALGLFHRVDGVALDALKKLGACGNVVYQPYHLTRGPNLR